MSDFGAGANIDGKHYFGINWERDLPTPQIADIRNVVEGDPSPCGKGTLLIKRGIEVGHIFQLGKKYSEAMKATVQGEDGKPQTMMMGCYGIGILVWWQPQLSKVTMNEALFGATRLPHSKWQLCQ